MSFAEPDQVMLTSYLLQACAKLLQPPDIEGKGIIRKKQIMQPGGMLQSVPDLLKHLTCRPWPQLLGISPFKAESAAVGTAPGRDHGEETGTGSDHPSVVREGIGGKGGKQLILPLFILCRLLRKSTRQLPCLSPMAVQPLDDALLSVSAQYGVRAEPAEILRPHMHGMGAPYQLVEGLIFKMGQNGTDGPAVIKITVKADCVKLFPVLPDQADHLWSNTRKAITLIAAHAHLGGQRQSSQAPYGLKGPARDIALSIDEKHLVFSGQISANSTHFLDSNSLRSLMTSSRLKPPSSSFSRISPRRYFPLQSFRSAMGSPSMGTFIRVWETVS